MIWPASPVDLDHSSPGRILLVVLGMFAMWMFQVNIGERGEARTGRQRRLALMWAMIAALAIWVLW